MAKKESKLVVELRKALAHWQLFANTAIEDISASNERIRLREREIQILHETLALMRKIVAEPMPIILHCPHCGERHIDDGSVNHHTHECQSCGFQWRPAVQCTRGVRFLGNGHPPEK